MGKVIMANPNSYASIRRCLGDIKESFGIGEIRKWAFVGCDGPPFCLMNRIIAESSEFDWIAPVSGLGHLSMNIVKTFFNVCDKILLEPLGKNILNFTTPKAYTFFTKCSDTPGKHSKNFYTGQSWN